MALSARTSPQERACPGSVQRPCRYATHAPDQCPAQRRRTLVNLRHLSGDAARYVLECWSSSARPGSRGGGGCRERPPHVYCRRPCLLCVLLSRPRCAVARYLPAAVSVCLVALLLLKRCDSHSFCWTKQFINLDDYKQRRPKRVLSWGKRDLFECRSDETNEIHRKIGTNLWLNYTASGLSHNRNLFPFFSHFCHELASAHRV